MEKKNKQINVGKPVFIALLFITEIVFIAFLFLFFPSNAIAGIGQNVTVITQLNIGNVFPEILSMNIDFGATSVDLIANGTKTVTVYAVVRDFNGEDDLINATAEFFDISASSYGDSDDNNMHYTNSSCFIDKSYGDAYEANVTCTFDVLYYANNATWNGTFLINDTYDYTAFTSDTINVNTLISIGLPDTIDYGTVNATYVSDEKVANVTNFGNVRTNISLEGYAVNQGDNLSMNCTLGAIKNISINYEKYNLTSSNTSALSLAQFELLYVNLTSSPVIRKFDLNYRQNDTFNEAVNATYWRIYVPTGVAGTCSGNIVFGAIRAAES